MSVCIFAGPTLPPRDDARRFPATWLPPARHGDVYHAVTLLRPRVIGIVDGFFQWVPSVWHKEILWSIQQGVHVFGAASMGALRAAELAPFGMRGVGSIFEAYRNGMLAAAGDEPFEDDDEVAVVHGPAEGGYLPGSDAMVNIRCTLANAERAGIIDAALRAQLVGIAKALFFPERSYDRMLERAHEAALPRERLAALRAWLPSGRVDQKRADGVAMLEAIQRFLASDPPVARAGFSFEHTILWERAIAALQPTSPHEPDEIQALAELRLDGMRFHDLRLQMLELLLAREHTAVEPLSTRDGELFDGEQDLDAQARRDAARRLQAEIPAALVERQMLAELRRTGDFAKMLARAQDKQARLRERAGIPQAWEFSELQLLELRDWYFSQVNRTDMPDDLDGYLRDSGYPDIMRFHEAIFAEYVYRQLLHLGPSEGPIAGR